MLPNQPQNLRDRLKDADPAEAPLEKARAQEIKAEILANLEESSRQQTGFRIPSFVWVSALALVFCLAMVWRIAQEPKDIAEVIQTASRDSPQLDNLRKTKVSELRFTTPGGTRIIWQFKDQEDRIKP